MKMRLYVAYQGQVYATSCNNYLWKNGYHEGYMAVRTSLGK